MTLPTLMKNHQRQVYVTQLKGTISLLSQAAETAITQHNATTLTETPYNNNVPNLFKDNLKVVQECTTTRTPCFASEYKFLDGTTFNSWVTGPSANNPCLALANGASVCTDGTFASDGYSNGRYIYYGWSSMHIDINGSQGPNVLGRDLFFVTLYSDGKLADSYWPESLDRYDSDGCSKDFAYGAGCLTKIMNDGWKMDY